MARKSRRICKGRSKKREGETCFQMNWSHCRVVWFMRLYERALSWAKEEQSSGLIQNPKQGWKRRLRSSNVTMTFSKPSLNTMWGLRRGHILLPAGVAKSSEWYTVSLGKAGWGSECWRTMFWNKPQMYRYSFSKPPSRRMCFKWMPFQIVWEVKTSETCHW